MHRAAVYRHQRQSSSQQRGKSMSNIWQKKMFFGQGEKTFHVFPFAHAQKLKTYFTQYNYEDEHPEYEKLKMDFLNKAAADTSKPMSIDEIKQNLAHLKQSEFADAAKECQIFSSILSLLSSFSLASLQQSRQLAHESQETRRSIGCDVRHLQ